MCVIPTHCFNFVIIFYCSVDGLLIAQLAYVYSGPVEATYYWFNHNHHIFRMMLCIYCDRHETWEASSLHTQLILSYFIVFAKWFEIDVDINHIQGILYGIFKPWFALCYCLK